MRKILLLSVACLLLAAVSDAAEQKYIYDREGLRDPFIPLVDEKSLTGLRTEFKPPHEQIRLPIELNLKGILSKGENYFAIINDQVVRQGDDLKGVQVKEIRQDKVILEYSEREFTLFLKH